MDINEDFIKKVSQELKFNLSKQELVSMQKDMTRLVTFIETFTQRDFPDVKKDILEKEDVTLKDGREKDAHIDLSLNTKYFELNHFVVPKVIDRD